MNKQLTYAAGYVLLGGALLLGVVLTWNARTTIDQRVTKQEEEAKPAEIEVTLIAPSSCERCIDGNILVKEIEKQNVRLLSSQTVLSDSEEGSALIETYGITRVPAIVIQGEYDKGIVKETLEALGGTQQGDALVIEVLLPVYLDLTNNEMVGLVDVTYITDSSCSDCYDPTQHKAILENNFGLTVQSERTVDTQSTEGRALVEQYALKQAPTVLLSSQALAYQRLVKAWQEVGTQEEDGTFVFRKNAALGPVIYKNLETGETIRPETSEE